MNNRFSSDQQKPIDTQLTGLEPVKGLQGLRTLSIASVDFLLDIIQRTIAGLFLRG